MKNFLVVGVGSIGKRHVESMGDLKFKFNIHVVDPLTDNIKIAKNLFYKKKKKTYLGNYIAYKNIKEVKTNIDIAIIATTADVRFEILTCLLKNNKIKFLLLEKIAFDNIKNYEKAMSLLKKSKIPTYVNFPRRLNTYYNKLRVTLKKEKNIFMSIVGNNWGFASNSFHNLDLFLFLTDSKKIKNISADINKKTYITDRKNFIEFQGYFSFINEFTDKIIMQDFKNLNSEKNSMYGGIKIETENITYIIYENFNKVVKIDNKIKANIKIDKINIDKQSSLTSKIILNALAGKKIKLPSLKESYVTHKSILEILNKKLNKFKIT